MENKEKIQEIYMDSLTRAFDFEGRSSRIQYWYFFGGNLAITIFLLILLLIIPGVAVALLLLLFLLTIIPSISLTVRRLHDLNMTGWLALLLIIPFLNYLFIIVLGLLKSVDEGNKYNKNISDKTE